MLHLASCWLTLSSHTITLFVLFNCSNFFTLPTLGLSLSPQELHVPSKNNVQTDLLSLLLAVLCEIGVEADSKKLNTSSAFAGKFNPFSTYLWSKKYLQKLDKTVQYKCKS